MLLLEIRGDKWCYWKSGETNDISERKMQKYSTKIGRLCLDQQDDYLHL